MTAEQDTDLLVYQNVRGVIVAMFFWRSNRTWFFPRSHGLFSLRLLATLAVLGMVSVSRGGRGKCEQRSVGYSHRIYATITTLAYLTGLLPLDVWSWVSDFLCPLVVCRIPAP